MRTTFLIARLSAFKTLEESVDEERQGKGRESSTQYDALKAHGFPTEPDLTNTDTQALSSKT